VTKDFDDPRQFGKKNNCKDDQWKIMFDDRYVPKQIALENKNYNNSK